YLTLSYVWGGDQAHKTTLSNITTYEGGIDPTLIPQTIRDAIYVTNALGFRWLWIDSLCIIQDSDQDKRRELARMHYIYRYAHLTIIAASAKRIGEGFLQDRSPPPQVNFNEPFSSADLILPFVWALWPNRGSDDLEPISTRGWCMQEYLMSPRSLIFTSKTLQFRCLTTTQNVGNSLRDTVDEWRIPSTLFLPEPPPAEHGSAEWDDVHGEWLGVLGDYSRRTTSLPSDKLVACGAVAEQFHRVLRSDYLAGVWRDSLLLDLLWCAAQGEHLYRPATYRAPSWSWAAVEGELSWRAGGPGEMMILDEDVFAKVVRCEVSLEDAALPFGRVTGGSLILR
ncbi:HET-domain-containing protein, partial [Trametes versicolor FP-101664 SS1]|uniref:HET-domain-containing protein n=1 Tax=Trametes versicolor (strain FP-101664) TaxID=717944 RepID=UPI00046235C4